MGAPINSKHWESQPCISYDGKSIYFSCNRPGGQGKMDIWVSTRDDDWNFGEPVNLGSTVNTPEQEQTPFIHTDDETLYFCSSGHMGLGMSDIFYTRRKPDGKFDSAVNIGYPINTPADEPGLVVDRKGEYAFFSSDNPQKSKGRIDIFTFRMPDKARPKPVNYLKGIAFDAYTKNPVQANYVIMDLATGKTVFSSTTDKSGKLLIPLPGGKDYLVNVWAKGYLFYSDNIPLKDYKNTEPYEKQIPLKPIRPGESVSLHNIFFDTDSYNLKEESTSELERLVLFMKTNPDVRIEISGHTDNSATPAHNKTLSQNRAKAVYEYLINKGGVTAARLTFAGYGETKPIASNDTPAGKALNRRTEIKVLE
jgi:outer membrane protein OmpA-like peptidoglycan-associated protein